MFLAYTDTSRLDKGNLGNAKTAGLEDTLHLKGDDYNTVSTSDTDYRALLWTDSPN